MDAAPCCRRNASSPSLAGLSCSRRYGAARTGDPSHELDKLSHAGTARCLVRMGEVSRGVALASDSGDPLLCRECAIILEGMKQWTDAALLFEKVRGAPRAARARALAARGAQGQGRTTTL